MEWIVDALKRTADLDDREALLQAIATTKMDTMWGPMDFTAPVQMGTNHPVLNVMTNPSTGGQWRTGTGKWPYDVIPVSNKFALDVPLNAEIQPLG
jgi:branched-chain amino acid transport system substrate-binding protein